MDDIYDLIIVGGEPAGLSLAAALHEHQKDFKLLILDKRPRFTWAGHDSPLPGSCMKTSLLYDLATPRNPKSSFTFVHYLWETKGLVDYTNLSFVNPPKGLFAHYLHWAAAKLEELDLVRYHQTVSGVEPVHGSERGISTWRIHSRDGQNGSTQTYNTRRIFIAVPPEPLVPAVLTNIQPVPGFFHSSDHEAVIETIRRDSRNPLNIAVLGGDDEAIELFEYIDTVAPRASVKLFLDEPMIRQTDNNPFLIKAIQRPGRSPYELQSSFLSRQTTALSSSSVDAETVSKLYQAIYSQSVKQRDGSLHKSQIFMNRQLVGSRRSDDDSMVLEMRDSATGEDVSHGPFNYVIAATGTKREEHKRLLRGLSPLLDSPDGSLSVDHEYRVNFKRGKVADTSAVWVLDGFENPGPNVWFYLALRTERILQSLLASEPPPAKKVAAAPVAEAPRPAL